MHAIPPAKRQGVWLRFLRVWILTLLGASALAQGVPAAPAASTTYSNLAGAALLKRAEEVSRSLTDAGLLPAESFTNATVVLEGQSTHPSARVLGSCCEYTFRQGFLFRVYRRDLFEDKGPDSLILHHLTNAVLTLTPQAATNRALEVLQRLSYQTNRLREVFQIYVRDAKMDAYPVRNGGPDFPKDLHFFGELLSREKIKITVGLHPAGPAALAASGSPAPDSRIDFLATTGELLEACWLPEPEMLSRLGIHAPDQITVAEAEDFTPPLFVSATRKLNGAETMATNIRADSVLRGAWNELQVKLGPHRPQCILLCDNLNDPAAVAAAVKILAGETPWAGVSHFFNLDLPFDHALMERVAQDKRGVALLAICGEIDTRLELLSNLNSMPPPDMFELGTPEGQEKWQQIDRQERQRLTPRLDDLLDRLRLPESFPDHALFLLQASVTCPSSGVVESELQTRLRGKAEVFSVIGSGGGSSVGMGVAYFNGGVFTNTMAVLRLSGSLPLQQDIHSLMEIHLASLTNSANFDSNRLHMLEARGQRRLISGEAVRPVRELAYAFGEHPLQDFAEFLGLNQIRMLQEADKLEVFEIKPGEIGTPLPLEAPTVEGYEMVAHAKALGRDAAREFAAALLTEKNGFQSMIEGPWQSVVVFRAWRGKESASLIVSFDRTQYVFRTVAVFKFYDANGKLTRQTLPFFCSGRQTLLRLARQALPDSSVLSAIDK